MCEHVQWAFIRDGAVFQGMVDQAVFSKEIRGWWRLSKDREKRSWLILDLVVFSWILDLVQKLTGRLSRIGGLLSWYWIWIDTAYQSTSATKLHRPAHHHKRRTARFSAVLPTSTTSYSQHQTLVKLRTIRCIPGFTKRLIACCVERRETAGVFCKFSTLIQERLHRFSCAKNIATNSKFAFTPFNIPARSFCRTNTLLQPVFSD